jgi:trans-2,3-dihydro-3-hydroxyanthranilate isomerase
MSERRYVTVDVFSDQAFGGNPLAVVLDAQGLDSAAMQSIAKEFNYSETTFVLPPVDTANTAHVRIFTPAEELPFAGHPNVGTAYVLAREGNAAPSLLFEEAAGLVPVAILRAAGEVIGAELTAPQSLQRSTTISAAAIAACLSLSPGDIVTSGHEPVIASVGTKFVLAELATRDALRRAQPDVGGFSAAFADHSCNKLYFYTRNGGQGFDLHSRMFTPMGGMREDPATGSATVTLAALLAEAGPDGETTLRIEQGRDMGRPSTLITRTIKHDGVVRSAHVGGSCVTMMRGVLNGP